MDKVAIFLDSAEVQEFEPILLDEDQSSALRLFRDCIGEKVALRTEAKHCRPTSEWRATEAVLLESLERRDETSG